MSEVSFISAGKPYLDNNAFIMKPAQNIVNLQFTTNDNRLTRQTQLYHPTVWLTNCKRYDVYVTKEIEKV